MRPADVTVCLMTACMLIAYELHINLFLGDNSFNLRRKRLICTFECFYNCGARY